MLRRRLLQSILIACAISAGCGSENDDDGSAQDAGPPAAEAAAADDGEGPIYIIPCPPQTPTFEQGLVVAGDQKRISAKLVSAQPTTPQLFENEWVVDLVDGTGTPISDVKLDDVRPFMPVHGHDGGFPPEWKALAEPGRMQIDRINLKMSGPWEVTLKVSSPSVGSDSIVINVCVPY
jgi:hypothetical protein